MATKIAFSFSSFHCFQHMRNAKLTLWQFVNQQNKSYRYIHGVPTLGGRVQKQQIALVVGSEDHSQISDNHDSNPEDIFPISNSSFQSSGNDGKPGVVSFYKRPSSRDNEVILSNSKRTLKNSISRFMAPAVIVASLFFPPVYLPEVLLRIYGDSTFTVSLIIFFTEAIFYCGVAVFLHLLDPLMRPIQLDPSANNSDTLTPKLGQRIYSAATLVLSLIIPMVIIGLAWLWAGPVALVALGPYLVSLIVEFTFEQHARYWKSPSWAAIPFIFQVYRLHQLYRTGNLLTYVSIELGATEMTVSKLHVTSSLAVLSSVLQILLVICIWSFSSLLVRFLSSASATMQVYKSARIHENRSDNPCSTKLLK
ncbi:hypothetical protein CR513_37455, partial [Mucuna pruriens]